MRWLRDKPSCEACKQIWERKGGEPPCIECRKVIADEDYDVAQVFFATRTHWIDNGEKVIDIDIKAVKCAMDIYGIKNQKECYERVRALFLALLRENEENA